MLGERAVGSKGWAHCYVANKPSTENGQKSDVWVTVHALHMGDGALHAANAYECVVRSFVLCGQGSSLHWTPALRPYSGPVRLPRERKGIGRCVRCMLASVG